MSRIFDCFGYKVKFVKVNLYPGRYLPVTFCYLNDVYVGLMRNAPPGYLFYGITPSGSYFTKGPTGIGCLRNYVLNCLLSDDSNNSDQEVLEE